MVILSSSLLFLLAGFKLNYASTWGHYGSRIVGNFSRSFREVLGSIIDIL